VHELVDLVIAVDEEVAPFGDDEDLCGAARKIRAREHLEKPRALVDDRRRLRYVRSGGSYPPVVAGERQREKDRNDQGSLGHGFLKFARPSRASDRRF
jgi:hypothetical protein